MRDPQSFTGQQGAPSLQFRTKQQIRSASV